MLVVGVVEQAKRDCHYEPATINKKLVRLAYGLLRIGLVFEELPHNHRVETLG